MFKFPPEFEHLRRQQLLEIKHHLDENQTKVLLMPTGAAREQRLWLIKKHPARQKDKVDD